MNKGEKLLKNKLSRELNKEFDQKFWEDFEKENFRSKEIETHQTNTYPGICVAAWDKETPADSNPRWTFWVSLTLVRRAPVQRLNQRVTK